MFLFEQHNYPPNMHTYPLLCPHLQVGENQLYMIVAMYYCESNSEMTLHKLPSQQPLDKCHVLWDFCSLQWRINSFKSYHKKDAQSHTDADFTLLLTASPGLRVGVFALVFDIHQRMIS